jgi:metal-responsive CopG/Arc/MetJ family transcriptional regulator
MATVNFSVPDDVKEAFDKTFGGQNKSAIIADLMRRAVRDHHLQKRRENLFRQLTAARSRRPTLTAAELQKARTAGRP